MVYCSPARSVAGSRCVSAVLSLPRSVHRYEIATGRLFVTYPGRPTVPAAVTVVVDVALVLEAEAVPCRGVDLAAGSWINVVGYLTGKRREPGRARPRAEAEAGPPAAGGRDDAAAALRPGRAASGVATQRRMRVMVQAVMVWSAGAVDVSRYDVAVAQRLE